MAWISSGDCRGGGGGGGATACITVWADCLMLSRMVDMAALRLALDAPFDNGVPAGVPLGLTLGASPGAATQMSLASRSARPV
ncbi:hypothetical protein GCM10022229_08620 [Luteimonas lutimaris]|uniref:Uncharacterized protein n=1 Tax=Luteimonas lutimaris TaxID=698645 RepID=A0ABP7M929_9GAMM